MVKTQSSDPIPTGSLSPIYDTLGVIGHRGHPGDPRLAEPRTHISNEEAQQLLSASGRLRLVDTDDTLRLPFEDLERPHTSPRSHRNRDRVAIFLAVLLALGLVALIMINFVLPAHAALETRNSKPASLDRFLAALRQVETGSRDLTGDGGEAIGPYQIHKPYWRDAVAQNPALQAAGYDACHQESYARAIVLAYLTRYAPAALAAGDWQTCARIHNGGPAGASKSATLAYWRKVQAAL